MKSVLFVLSMLTISITTMAQWASYNGGNVNSNYGSTLTVNTQKSSNFVVSIDNNSSYQSQGNFVNIGALAPGRHNIVVYEWRKSLFGQRRQTILYNEWIYIKQNVNTNLYFDAFGRANITEQIVVNNNYGNGRQGRGNSCNDNDRDNRRRKNNNIRRF
jgi:hypothetical protein